MKNDIENMNKNQLEMKNPISEIKNTQEEIKSRPDKAQDQISDLEYKVEKKTPNHNNKKKKDLKITRNF